MGTLIIGDTGLGGCEAHVKGCADLKKKRFTWVVEKEVEKGEKAKTVVHDFFFDDFAEFEYATKAEFEAAECLAFFVKIFPCIKKTEEI